MEIIEDPDLSRYTMTEESDTGNGLRIQFYESEELGSLLNLDWDEDSRWAYLGGEDIVKAFTRMIEELLGEEEAALVMKGKAIVPIEEMKEIREAVGDAVMDQVLEEECVQIEMPL